MKKLVGIIILSILLSSTSFAGVKKGKGDVTMTTNSLEIFIEYFRGKKGQKPLAFILSSNGSWATFWYCSASGGCRDGNYGPTIRECEEKTGVDCGLFARKRTIVWKNDINPGKGKASKINSKWSDAEIRAKLTELGFLGGSTSSSTTNKKIKEGVVYFNKCSWSLNEDQYHWSFEVDLNKGSYLKEVFFAKGEIYNDKFEIILNNDDFIKTKIKNIYDDKYVQYEFNKKKDEITKFTYNDKKGKDKDDTTVLICNDIVGTLNSLKTASKKKKKEPKKVVKKYELKGERSIALSWDGYEDLIAGTVEFDEADYKGTLNIPLPNNDGNCDGSYSLQEGGKGTWQIACSNTMGAAGTLKWTEKGGVTGKGRDHNDKKVKFTVSKKS
jgi:hypothetical protein